MKIQRVTAVYFSATGNTRQIISAVIEGLRIDEVRKFDLTRPKVREEFLDLNFKNEEFSIYI